MDELQLTDNQKLNVTLELLARIHAQNNAIIDLLITSNSNEDSRMEEILIKKTQLVSKHSFSELLTEILNTRGEKSIDELINTKV